MSKLVHYRDKCIGCGICFEMQPDYWRMSTRDGKATLVKAQIKSKVHQRDVQEWDLELSNKVANACPVKVIKIM